MRNQPLGSRRARFWFAVAWLGILFFPAASAPQEAPVPPALQALLLAKVAAYDQNFAARVGNRVELLIVEKRDVESHRAAEQLQAAFAGVKEIALVPLIVSRWVFIDAAGLMQQCASHHVSIAYLSTGFSSDEVRAIAASAGSTSLLTASMTPSDVDLGIVVGFDLVAGKPQIDVNLGQSRRQQVSFSASLLQLAKVQR